MCVSEQQKIFPASSSQHAQVLAFVSCRVSGRQMQSLVLAEAEHLVFNKMASLPPLSLNIIQEVT